MGERFRLVSDDDGHHYVIPENRLHDWFEYLNDVYSGKDWLEEPAWVREVGGSVDELLTFTDPQIGGK